RVRRVDGAVSAPAGRARHARRFLGTGQFARELGWRDARHPRDLRLARGLYSHGRARVGALEGAPETVASAAVPPDRSALARRERRAIRAGRPTDSARRARRVRGAARTGGRAALSADQLRTGTLGDSRA